jgi:hypothetical protein
LANSFVAVSEPKFRELVFSHVHDTRKNILPKFAAARTQTRLGSAPPGEYMLAVITGRIRRGEPVLFGMLAEKLLKGAEPKTSNPLF